MWLVCQFGLSEDDMPGTFSVTVQFLLVEASDSESELFVCITATLFVQRIIFACCGFVGNSRARWLFPCKDGIIIVAKEL
jgi:hypothetical protein